MFKFNLSLFAAAIFSTFASTSASASMSWSYSGGDYCSYSCGNDSEGSYGSSYNYNYDSNSSGSYAKVASWSDDSYGKLKNATTYQYSNGYGAKNGYEGTGEYYNSQYSGDEDYLIDNNGKTDSVLFDYGDKCVVVNSVTYGWTGYDADIKVMAFIGDKYDITDKNGKKYTTMADYLADKSYAQLAVEESQNWKTYTYNYANKNSYSNFEETKTFAYKQDQNGNYLKDQYGNKIKDEVASSYWLVMAGNGGDGKDYFKIKNLGGHNYDGAGCTQVQVKCDQPVPPSSQVPVPGTLALLGLGLVGIGVRRKKA